MNYILISRKTVSLNNKEIVFKIGILLLFISAGINAQDTIKTDSDQSFKTYKVQWVNQYPTLKEQKKKADKGWFTKFILGGRNIPGLTKPIGIVALNSDSYYVLDQAIGVIFKIKNNEIKIPKNFKKNVFNFTSLVGLCNFHNSDVLLTDSRLNKIFKFNESQKILEIFNDETQLNQPTGIAYSAISKEIWVVETTAHRISVLNEKGKLIRKIGGRGNAPGEFNFPTAIWIDKTGNVYVVDTMNFRIQIFNKKGEIISVFGEIGNATGYFARPKGIATDSYGNIYVTDALYHTVQVFDISGNFLYQFGEQGRGKEQFWMPSDIYIDDNNYIYVADSYNSRIQIFKLINGK
jgi:DNA-binding beta-propeller fold protein YncE